MHKYNVVATEQIAPTTQLITLKHTQPWKAFNHQPGQYAAISFKKGIRPTPARCFSIVSSPIDQDILQFSMRTKGHYTQALQGIKEGDEVSVRGPFGGFIFDTMHDGDVVFLAGGIGITPFMSMVRFAANLRISNQVRLLYSCRSQDDIPFRDDLIELEKKNPNFKVLFIIGDGPIDKLTGQKVEKGRITPDIIGSAISEQWQDQTFFICGPPPFMNGMLGELKEHGVQKNKIKTEAFGQGQNQQTGKVRDWPLNMYIFGGVGLAAASFIVMASDMFKTLPPSSLVGSKSITSAKKLTNTREVNLDFLVNSFSESDYNARPSGAVVSASQATASPAATTAAAPAQTTTVRRTTTSSAPVAAAPTATAPAPAPSGGGTTGGGGGTPAPVCTTSPSGVQTCI
jgi:ferredoxin-NADP reductase